MATGLSFLQHQLQLPPFSPGCSWGAICRCLPHAFDLVGWVWESISPVFKATKNMSCYEVLLSLDCFGSSSILVVLFKRTYFSGNESQFQKGKNKGTTIIKSPNPNFQGSIDWDEEPQPGCLSQMSQVKVWFKCSIPITGTGSIPRYSNVYIYIYIYRVLPKHWLTLDSEG